MDKIDKNLSKKLLKHVSKLNELDENAQDMLLMQTESLETLMTMYQCAITKLRARIEVVTAEFEINKHRNPVEYIESRIKKPAHIIEKLHRKGVEISVDSIIYNLNDVAGIRLICSFVDDIYEVADMLLKDTTFTLVETVDYIKNPKPNGYRSLHLVVEVPIVFSNAVQKMRVEVQIRTIAMDFWAQLEHQMHYKKAHSEKDEQIVKELKDCADTIYQTDLKMQALREKLNSQQPKG